MLNKRSNKIIKRKKVTIEEETIVVTLQKMISLMKNLMKIILMKFQNRTVSRKIIKKMVKTITTISKKNN